MSIRCDVHEEVKSKRQRKQRDVMSIGGDTTQYVAPVVCFPTQKLCLKVRWRAKCCVLQ